MYASIRCIEMGSFSCLSIVCNTVKYIHEVLIRPLIREKLSCNGQASRPEASSNTYSHLTLQKLSLHSKYCRQ